MGLRIIILGAPGAGKGTQAQRVAAAHGLPHVSTGDIFRAHLKQGTELGKRVQQYLNAGALVPDELTCEIVANRLAEGDCAEGFILDGFPRSIPQAENLDALLNARGQRIDVAVDIAVPDETIIERLSARRSCPVCGAIYNLKFGPPKRPNHCDRSECGETELIQRPDDSEATIRRRLEVYHETTEPILGYYRGQSLLRSVPGDAGTPDDIFLKVEETLRSVEPT